MPRTHEYLDSLSSATKSTRAMYRSPPAPIATAYGNILSKLWILLGIIIVGAVAYYFLQPATAEITNFEQCIEAGNPAMESYPRQCRDSKSDRTFTEIIEEIPIQSPVEPPIEPIGEVVCEDYTFSNCPATCAFKNPRTPAPKVVA